MIDVRTPKGLIIIICVFIVLLVFATQIKSCLSDAGTSLGETLRNPK